MCVNPSKKILTLKLSRVCAASFVTPVRRVLSLLGSPEKRVLNAGIRHYPQKITEHRLVPNTLAGHNKQLHALFGAALAVTLLAQIPYWRACGKRAPQERDFYLASSVSYARLLPCLARFVSVGRGAPRAL